MGSKKGGAAISNIKKDLGTKNVLKTLGFSPQHSVSGPVINAQQSVGPNGIGGAINKAIEKTGKEAGKLVPTPGPAMPNITSPVTQAQIDASQGGVTNSLASQEALVAALRAQNNPVNQSSAYNALNDYSTALGGAGGLNKQQAAATALGDVYGQQQGTADQLQGIVQGTGPNPAMAALNQRTGENVANQAALMAGQRGAGANVGMMARQAAQQGGNLQQQAVGQGATMQAQQSLNALGQIGEQQSQMAATQSALGNLGTTQVGAGQTALGAQASQANTQAANQIGANNQAVQGNIQNVGQQLGAAGNFNQAATAGQASVNAANSALAQQGLKNKGDIVGGVLNGAGAASMAAFAEGGEIGDEPQVAQEAPTPTSGMSSWGSFMKNLSNPASQDSKLQQGSSKATQGLIGALGMAAMAQGGLAAQGGGVSAGSPAQAATVPGNSYANDKINAVLSEGEVVIPRSIMMGKDPVRGAADFVAKILAKKGRK